MLTKGKRYTGIQLKNYTNSYINGSIWSLNRPFMATLLLRRFSGSRKKAFIESDACFLASSVCLVFCIKDTSIWAFFFQSYSEVGELIYISSKFFYVSPRIAKDFKQRCASRAVFYCMPLILINMKNIVNKAFGQYSVVNKKFSPKQKLGILKHCSWHKPLL